MSKELIELTREQIEAIRKHGVVAVAADTPGAAYVRGADVYVLNLWNTGATLRNALCDQALASLSLKEDAERWRFVRDNALAISWQSGRHKSGSTQLCPVGDLNTAAYWDAAIDAARRASDKEAGR